MTPWVAPMPSATSATRGGSPSEPASLRFSWPRKAVAGAYGTAGMHASKTSVAAAPQSPPAPSDAIASTRPTAAWSLRSWKWRARRYSSVWLKSSACISVEQLARRQVEVDRREPRAQQRAAVVGADVGGQRAAAGVALRHDPLDHPQHDRGVGRRALAAAVGAQGDRHRGVRPLGGRALLAVGVDAAGAQVVEELARRARRGRLGPRAADVDPGVVVGAADAGAAVGVDVDGGGRVELGRAGAVADLPDAEQLGEAPPVPRGQRRLHRVERVRERAGDLLLAQVLGDLLDVAGVRLQPLVVAGRDPEAEDVHRLRLAGEARGQLLGDEHVGAVGDLQRAVDRVVVGDGHEVHPAALGQRVDLLGRRGALRQAQRALDAELGDRRGGGVAVQVGPGGRLGLALVSSCPRSSLQIAGSSDRSVNGPAYGTMRSVPALACLPLLVEILQPALGLVVAAGGLRGAVGRAPGGRVGELLLERLEPGLGLLDLALEPLGLAALVLRRAGGRRAAGAGAGFGLARLAVRSSCTRSSRTRRYSAQPPT